ncbi:hypothetical protein JXB41_04070 [Candidatus Woesearchaeota archaeon]|nr:hypothetical protein [Candidatus Woesearchaeota archaeon]
MILSFNDLDKLFKEIDETLKEKVHFYVIGGAVMLYHGMKTATKDVDIVVDSTDEFRTVEKLLKNIGFESKIPTTEYKKIDLNQMFIRNDYRIDLFQRTVCKGFILSKSMMKRAETIRTLKNLSISLCSTTDIFMFKTFTERPGDIDDCLLLAEKGIDWDVMLAEIKSQIRTSEQRVWITYIGERLDLLENRNLVIPIMNEINKLREEYFNDLEKGDFESK